MTALLNNLSFIIINGW